MQIHIETQEAGSKVWAHCPRLKPNTLVEANRIVKFLASLDDDLRYRVTVVGIPDELTAQPHLANMGHGSDGQRDRI